MSYRDDQESLLLICFLSRKYRLNNRPLKTVDIRTYIHTYMLARSNCQARTGTGEYYFPCSADHEQKDWQPYPVDPYSAICDDHVSESSAESQPLK